jgi:hypothetical protein
MRGMTTTSITRRCSQGAASLALATILIYVGAPTSAHAAGGSCRGSAARASGPQQVTFEPVVANPAATPCVSDSHELLGVSSGGGLSVTDPRAATEASAGTLSASASDDSASLSGSPAISVGHVAARQTESCSGGVNVASGSSSVDGLTVAGTPVSVVGGQSIDQTIAGVRIRTNQLSGATRQALVLDVGGNEYVLGEASAAGDACAASGPGGGEGSGVGGGYGGGAPSPGGGAGLGGGGLPGAFASGLGASSGVTGGTLAYRVAASQLALQCPRRRITLIDVLWRGTRVSLLGAADMSLVGHKVTITLLATHKRVASAIVGSDGFFGTTAPLPAPRLRFTNKASYQASIGTQRSAYLKLTRRMLIQSISGHAGKIVIRGRVTKPLTQPIAAILVKRRLSCSSTATVKRIKPRRDGTFTVTLTAPVGARAALYLATTMVRQSVRNRRHYPTSTLPRVVVIQ